MSAVFLFILLGVYTKAGAAYWICFGYWCLWEVFKATLEVIKND